MDAVEFLRRNVRRDVERTIRRLTERPVRRRKRRSGKRHRKARRRCCEDFHVVRPFPLLQAWDISGPQETCKELFDSVMELIRN